MKVKEIEISGKKYTLTANRRTIKTLYSIAPSLLSTKGDEDEEKTSVDLVANLDVLFYDMIKIAHPNISKEKSDDILEKFEEEYEDVEGNLVDLALTVFQSGDQTKKKKINW